MADLRATTSRYPHDPALRRLVDDLRAFEAFAALWSRPAVSAHQRSRKTVHHPEVGDLDIDCDVLATQGSDLRVLVLTPHPGGDRLELLATLGTQSLSPR